MNTCATCKHHQIDRIDEELRGRNVFASDVARRYGISGQALRRHRRAGHVQPAPLPDEVPSAAAALGSDASALDRMRAVVTDLGAIDTSELSASAKASHLDRYARALRDLARLEPAETGQSDLEQRLEEAESWAAVIMTILEKYPDIRDEVAAERRRQRGADPMPSFGDSLEAAP